MSDARFLRSGGGCRVLCKRCACIGILYSPEDTLRRYFESEYDVSPAIQNNLVVMGGREVVPKRSRVYKMLFEQLETLPQGGINCLEIACGDGNLIRSIKTAYPGWSCVGVDPSAQLDSSGGASGLTFLRSFFHEIDLPAQQFDVVIAHGFLNRSAILPELARISRIAKPGALISLELLELEDSHFVPYIWDHPYMYLRESLHAYLRHSGITVAAMQDCGSARHYICRKSGSTASPADFQTAASTVAAALAQFQVHERWWLDVVLAARKHAASAKGPIYLFGAGIYNVVLAHLLDLDFVMGIIDEQKAGETRWGLRVIGIEEASKAGGTALVCARPSYLPVMLQKLAAAGIAAIALNPEPAVERAGRGRKAS
jgi:ubiquinone/menaquinone biosynthesis C-methylase UbiE